MGWATAICAVQQEGNKLVPLAPARFEHEDDRWHIWSSINKAIKHLIDDLVMSPLTGQKPFGGEGRFHGHWLPFLNQDASMKLKAQLPVEITQVLEENIGDEHVYCFPARLKDWLEFDFDLPLWTSPEGETFTYRQFLDRNAADNLFEALAYLKTKGDPADIYLLAYWY